MIQKAPDECDVHMTSRASTPGAPAKAPPGLLALPQEILEHVFFLLTISDRLKLIRTCSLLRDIYASSPPLQYDFNLHTNAYLDVPFIPPPRARSASPTESTDSDGELAAVDELTSAAARRVFDNDRPLSAQEKNALLADRERRWQTMDNSCTRKFKMSGPAGVYELQEGIFLMCDEYSDIDEGKPTSVRLIPLPSAQDPDLENSVLQPKSQKLDFSIADLTMDPTQDLIVVGEHLPASHDGDHSPPTHRYHLLTLSTFEPHPFAAVASLDFPPFTQPSTHTRQLLQVMDDVLVVLVSKYASPWHLAGLAIGLAGLAGMGHEEEILCWNWKTGKVLSRLALPENGWFASLAILTPTTFMVTSTSSVSPVLPTEPRSLAPVFPPVIQIYSILPDRAHTFTPAQPLEPDYMDDTTARPVLVAQLDLPRFAEGVMVGTFDIRPDPAFPPHTAHSVGQRKTFTQNPEKGLVVFELQMLEPSDPALGPQNQMTARTYELFMLRETLVEMAKEGEERLREQRSVGDGTDGGYALWRVERTYRWEEWGVKNARMMDVSMSRRNWVCSCSGYRFISLVPRDLEAAETDEEDQHELIPSRPRRCDLRLLDFSPYNIRRPLLESSLDDSQIQVTIRSAPTVLEKRKTWRDDVRTELVYQEITRYTDMRANGVMIDDQRIMVVNTRGRRNGDWSNISQELTIMCM